MIDNKVKVVITEGERGLLFMLVSQTMECKYKFRQFNPVVKEQFESLKTKLCPSS